MLKIAAIITEYLPDSHADVLVGKFLRGFPCDDGLHAPRVQVASMYLDQVSEDDTGTATAEEFGVGLYPTIAGALRLGGNKVAVDGVLIIGEHGEYPQNEWGQTLYPRQHFFEAVTKVLGAEGKSVPVFNDKHLSYNWQGAKWMYQAAGKLQLPFMAGSSLPVCWRRPWLDYPLDTRLEAAVGIGYGPLESYGFHALEMIQCMVERRMGGEIGVEQVRCIEGDAVWEYLQESPEHGSLAQAAARAIGKTNVPWARVHRMVERPVAFLIRHLDGLETVALMLEGFSQSFSFAGYSADGARACEFVLQRTPPHAHFSYLGRNIEEMFITGQPTYPVERTLLTTGILAAAMESRYREHCWIPTPHLAICYQPPEAPAYRPLGPAPAGACLEPWPPQRQGE